MVKEGILLHRCLLSSRVRAPTASTGDTGIGTTTGSAGFASSSERLIFFWESTSLMQPKLGRLDMDFCLVFYWLLSLFSKHCSGLDDRLRQISSIPHFQSILSTAKYHSKCKPNLAMNFKWGNFDFINSTTIILFCLDWN